VPSYPGSLEANRCDLVTFTVTVSESLSPVRTSLPYRDPPCGGVSPIECISTLPSVLTFLCLLLVYHTFSLLVIHPFLVCFEPALSSLPPSNYAFSHSSFPYPASRLTPRSSALHSEFSSSGLLYELRPPREVRCAFLSSSFLLFLSQCFVWASSTRYTYINRLGKRLVSIFVPFFLSVRDQAVPHPLFVLRLTTSFRGAAGRPFSVLLFSFNADPHSPTFSAHVP